MKTTLAALLALSLFAGCKKSSTSQCADSINKSVDKMISSRKDRLAAQGSALPPEMKARMDERVKLMDEMGASMKQVMTNRCTEDKWPADVLKCYEGAGSVEEIRKCREMLPQDQQQKLRADEQQVMMKAMGAAGGPGMGAMPPGHEGMGGPGMGGPAAGGMAGSGAAPSPGGADQNGAPSAIPPVAPGSAATLPAGSAK
ncbi:MAG: hypothetical protein JO257_03210 [Deltaproteobacteria bacterium]|nr:hypothetical protein [Deltaproteobacteria bacterium]